MKKQFWIDWFPWIFMALAMLIISTTFVKEIRSVEDLNVCEAIEIFNQGFAEMDQELINQVSPTTLADIEVSREQLRDFFQETFGISNILNMEYGPYIPVGDKCEEPVIPFYHEVIIRYEKTPYFCTSILRGYFMATWIGYLGEGLQVRFIERLPSVITCDLMT